MLERDKARACAATRWPASDVSLVAYIEADRAKILQVYRIKPELIREHFGTEQSVLSSGYRYRQIFEVVQNAADAILEVAEAGEDGGRILVRVTDTQLYVGNTGAPLNKDGVIALLGANSFDTLVRDGATCNSACPLIWFAGRFRYLGRGARLESSSRHSPDRR